MNFSDLKSLYPYKTELHAHTSPISPCGKLSPDMVTRIHAASGCHSLVIANHLGPKQYNVRTEAELCRDFIADYEVALKAAEGLDIDVIFAAEIHFLNTANDYLVFGICPDDIERLVSYVPTNIQKFYTEFKNDKNVIIHAHPFRDKMDEVPLGYVDGIEVFNLHVAHNSRVATAARFAREHDLLITGGSDLHDPSKQSLCLMRTRERLRDSYDVARAIKSRDVIFDSFGNLIIPYQ